MEKNRLGLGLDALFNKATSSKSVQEIEIEKIKLPKWQPRQNFDQASIEELAKSIKIHGVLQPVLLRKVGLDFELVAGERRLRASKFLNNETISAIILEDEKNALEISMIENLQRQDLNPVEKALGFAFLIEKLKLNQEQLAKRLGVSRSVIANYLRINTLEDEIKEKLITGELTFGHAKIIASKENAVELAAEVVKKKLSVSALAKKESKPKEQSKESANKSDIKRFEEMISESMKCGCEIEYNKDSGKISLIFNNTFELEELIEKLCL